LSSRADGQGSDGGGRIEGGGRLGWVEGSSEGATLGAALTAGLATELADGVGVPIGAGLPVDGAGVDTTVGMHAPTSIDVASSSPPNRLEPFELTLVGTSRASDADEAGLATERSSSQPTRTNGLAHARC
jgi:hypothetical protein